MTYHERQDIIEQVLTVPTHEDIPVPFRQPDLHAKGEPFCYDPLCSCHFVNWLKHLCEPYYNGLLASSEADRLFMGHQCP